MNLAYIGEEALAAHELARTHMADRQKSTFTPFRKGDQVWQYFTLPHRVRLQFITSGHNWSPLESGGLQQTPADSTLIEIK